MLIKNKTMAQKKKTDIYEKITNIVIKGLQEKGLNWFKSWTNEYGQEMLPVNHISGKAYRGINVFICYASAMEYGYPTNEWIGYKQAKDMGYKVPKGATEIFYWYTMYFDATKKKWIYFGEYKKLTKGMSAEAKANRFTQRMFPKSQFVWNIAQLTETLDGKSASVEPKWTPQKPMINEDKNAEIKKAKAVYKNMELKPSLRHGGSRAYYRPSAHHIQMPKLDTFKTSEDYYKVLFHEMVHSTGNEQILNRKGVAKFNGFGTETYSREELVAEIGSMMLCSKINLIPSDEYTNSKAYINGWVKYLKNHKKEVMTACAQSQKAVEYILNETK